MKKKGTAGAENLRRATAIEERKQGVPTGKRQETGEDAKKAPPETELRRKIHPKKDAAIPPLRLETAIITQEGWKEGGDKKKNFLERRSDVRGRRRRSAGRGGGHASGGERDTLKKEREGKWAIGKY